MFLNFNFNINNYVFQGHVVYEIDLSFIKKLKNCPVLNENCAYLQSKLIFFRISNDISQTFLDILFYVICPFVSMIISFDYNK